MSVVRRRCMPDRAGGEPHLAYLGRAGPGLALPRDDRLGRVRLPQVNERLRIVQAALGREQVVAQPDRDPALYKGELSGSSGLGVARRRRKHASRARVSRAGSKARSGCGAAQLSLRHRTWRGERRPRAEKAPPIVE